MVYHDYDLCENCETTSLPRVRNTLEVVAPKENIKEVESKMSSPEAKPVHKGIRCNKCRIKPIVGTRYFERKRSDHTIILF